MKITYLCVFFLLLSGCFGENDIGTNNLTKENIKGEWIMDISATHPDQFICELDGSPGLVRSVSDCEEVSINIEDEFIYYSLTLTTNSPWTPKRHFFKRPYSLSNDGLITLVKPEYIDTYNCSLSDDGKTLTIGNTVKQVYNRGFSCEVPGIVPVIDQLPCQACCWAASTAMMMSWKDNQTYEISEAIAKGGDHYLNEFNAGKGLPVNKVDQFAKDFGFKIEPLMTYSVKGFKALLEENGPLWVGTNEGGSSFSPHARIATGMFGDGTPEDTFVEFNDPWGGKKVTESYKDFIKKFEELSTDPAIGIQIVHY